MGQNVALVGSDLGRLIDQSGGAVMAIDREGSCVYANAATAQLLDISLDALLGASLWAAQPDLAESSLAGALEHAFTAGGASTALVYLFGSGRWLDAWILPSADAVLVILTDVTDCQTSIDIAPKAQEPFFQASLDALSAQIAILDEQGTILAVNRAWRRFAFDNGVTWADDGVGRSYESYVADTRCPCGDAADAFAAGIRAAIQGEHQEFVIEYPCSRPSGDVWFMARVTRFTGAGPVRVVVSHEDITLGRHADEEYTAFIAAVSHDLKNPIGVIQAQAQLLRRRAKRGKLDRDQMDRGLETIETAGARMTTLLDELLDLSQLEAGQLVQLQRRPTDLVALVRDCVESYGLVTAHHQIVVEMDPSELIGSWDEVRMRRVVENLLNNAIKYSPDGGRITLAVDCDAINGAPAGRLTVSDEGVGIPERDRPHIFKRFRRGGNVRGIAGTGIGLAAARQIIIQHGGTIDVASTEGAGSRFTIRLPLAAPGAAVTS
jgi:signal transduction histidine kinase